MSFLKSLFQSADRRLVEAAKKGDSTEIAGLIKKGAQAGSRDENGFSALHWASSRGHVAAAEILLKNGADPNDKIKEDGMMPIHCAAYEHHLNVVRLLLEAGAQIDGITTSKKTALHIASMGRDKELVNLLLSKGANMMLRETDNMGPTAFHYAAGFGDVDIAALFLEKGMDPNVGTLLLSITPLHLAASNGHVPMVEYLLSQKADPNARMKPTGKTPLGSALERGHSKVAEILRQKTQA